MHACSPLAEQFGGNYTAVCGRKQFGGNYIPPHAYSGNPLRFASALSVQATLHEEGGESAAPTKDSFVESDHSTEHAGDAEPQTMHDESIKPADDLGTSLYSTPTKRARLQSGDEAVAFALLTCIYIYI